MVFAENEKERREAIDNRQSNRVRTGNLKLKAKEEKRGWKRSNELSNRKVYFVIQCPRGI